MYHKQFVEFAAAHRIPAMYEFGFIVHDGGLMPTEQPTRYYLTLNLTTAAALGLAVPASLLLGADAVIQ